MTARTVPHAPRAVFLALPPQARRGLLVSAALLALLAGGYFGWLRNSSLVAVEEVEITGLSAPSADRIERALTAAAEDMTTLHVRPDELKQAVAGFPVVQAIHVQRDFPHGLRIRVIERRPVALLETGDERVAVAGDGTLLPDVDVAGTLPHVRADAAASGGRLSDGAARALMAVAGAAPARLLARAEGIQIQSGRGIVVELRDGPELIFGDGSRPRAKWVAASAVLAQESSQGASYLDLRIPGRPAAGGLGAETLEPIDPAGAQGATSAEAQVMPAETQVQPQLEGSPGG